MRFSAKIRGQKDSYFGAPSNVAQTCDKFQLRDSLLALSSSNETPTSFTLSWEPMVGMDGYIVGAYYNSDFTNPVTGWKERDVNGALSVDFSGLTSADVYVRVTPYKNSGVGFLKSDNIIGNYFGDSIVAVGFDNNLVENLLSLTGITFLKKNAVSSATITNTSGTCLANQAVNTFENAEVVYLGAMTNDYSQQVAIGANTDNVVTTFKGAINVFVSNVRSVAPNARIIFQTATYRDTTLYPPYSPEVITLQEYREALHEMGQLLGCEVIEAGVEAPVNAGNYTTYLSDGLHWLIPDGYNLMYPWLADKINNSTKQETSYLTINL